MALCVGVALLSLVRLRRSLGWAVLLGAALGFSVLLRTDSLLLVALPVACALLAMRPSIRFVLITALASMPFLVPWAWYDDLRYGSPVSLTSSGDVGSFTHPFLDGFVSLLVSPGKGLLWFAPILLLSLWGLRSAYRCWPILTILAVVLIGSRVLFFASWFDWAGGLSFGPRFILPAVPAFTVPMTALVMTQTRRGLLARFGVPLVAIGAVVALVGSVSFGSWGTNAPPASWRSNPVVIVIRAHT